MIRNPWPNRLLLPDDKDWCYVRKRNANEIRTVFCPYNLRRTMVCMHALNSRGGNRTRRKAECEDCYWRQQAMGYIQMSREGVRIERYCDRCGARIENPDSPMYVLLEDKRGRVVINLEICRDCAAELTEWVGGAELPPASEVDESVWG